MSERKAILITGAASGIGLATARRFAGEGWFVGLADIDQAGLDRALAEIGPANGLALAFDVRDRAGWAKALTDFARASGGRLDVLMNNAGVARMGWLEEQTAEDVDLQVDINLKGVINGSQAAVELLRATPLSQVVNVASVAGLAAPPQMSVYAATKFAVRGLSEAMDVEFARFGVRVRCIMPWFLDTPILDKAGARSNQDVRAFLKANAYPIYRVEEASTAIWNAVHGTGLHHVVGARARQLKTLARWAPGLIRMAFLKAAAS